MRTNAPEDDAIRTPFKCETVITGDLTVADVAVAFESPDAETWMTGILEEEGKLLPSAPLDGLREQGTVALES